MTPIRLFALTAFAMTAFAANSILCRLALAHTSIDPASFTSIRLASGALVLWLFVRFQNRHKTPGGNWLSAAALFLYAAAFSFAYISLPAGIGALLLFGAVQVTMIVAGLRAGERLSLRQTGGLALALIGLVVLLRPGLTAPPVAGSILMLTAGIAWGIYSLRGRRSGDPVIATAGNFLRAAPIAIVLSLLLIMRTNLDPMGILYALLSGALTSGVGYVAWYAALRGMTATGAAIVQLSVPVIAALGGILLLGETLTLRLVLASLAILGGIALAVARRNRKA
ncbi:MAG: DMT family transporter [Gammaproteobacteria bacterium]